MASSEHHLAERIDHSPSAVVATVGFILGAICMTIVALVIGQSGERRAAPPVMVVTHTQKASAPTGPQRIEQQFVAVPMVPTAGAKERVVIQPRATRTVVVHHRDRVPHTVFVTVTQTPAPSTVTVTATPSETSSTASVPVSSSTQEPTPSEVPSATSTAPSEALVTAQGQ